MKGIIITMLLISAFLGGHLQAEDLKWDLPFLVKMNDKILEQQTKEWKNVPLSQIQKAAVQGDVNAQFILGLKYNNSVGYGNRAQDWLNKAAEQYSIIAKQGNARAQFILGWMYENRLIFAANGVEQGLQTEAPERRKAGQSALSTRGNLGATRHELNRAVAFALAEDGLVAVFPKSE